MTSLARAQSPVPGVPRAVLVAAACFAISAGATALAVSRPQHPPSGILLIGWPVFALAGGILLDQRRFDRLGRVLCTLSLIPVAIVILAVVSAGSLAAIAPDILDVISRTSALQVAGLLLAVPFAARPPEQRRISIALMVAAVTAATAVTLGPDSAKSLQVTGWCVAIAATAGLWARIARDTRADPRMPRRRVTWVMLTLALATTVVLAGWWSLPTGVACYLTATGLALTTTAVTVLCLTETFRPLNEHLLDLALVTAVAAGAALVALLVRQGSVWTNLPSPTISAAFAAILTAATAIPAALWARRALLARQYGGGAISPDDVAVITADLGAQADPRALLGKAARMVASASGSRDARLVLGDELPEVPDGWMLHPLDVGGERVGVLAVQSRGIEGPEPRQEDVIARLIPTVALVARAVSLAVEAELARRDVSRERDLERRRILADLHDGLGPVLAGMSMHVGAALRAASRADPPSDTGLLSGLADSLARSRTDLRRIVAGITPSALDDGDLGAALTHLVESFRSQGADGPSLFLDVDLGTPVAEAAQIAVYRCVAEGVTNALRHAGASAIAIRVTSAENLVLVDVTDDGAGGRIVPGVGLSSLCARAEGLGGLLVVGPAASSGTRLHLELPHREGVSG